MVGSGQARQVLTAESPSPLTRRRPAPFPFDNGSVTHLEPLQNDISVRGRVCPARLSHAARSWTRRQMTGNEYRTPQRVAASAPRPRASHPCPTPLLRTPLRFTQHPLEAQEAPRPNAKCEGSGGGCKEGRRGGHPSANSGHEAEAEAHPARAAVGGARVSPRGAWEPRSQWR